MGFLPALFRNGKSRLYRIQYSVWFFQKACYANLHVFEIHGEEIERRMRLSFMPVYKLKQENLVNEEIFFNIYYFTEINFAYLIN